MLIARAHQYATVKNIEEYSRILYSLIGSRCSSRFPKFFQWKAKKGKAVADPKKWPL